MGTLGDELRSGKIDYEKFKKTMDIEELELIHAKEENFGLRPTPIGPDGVFLRRNETDLMNNFSIDNMCLSYLQTSSGFKSESGNLNEKRTRDLEAEIERQSFEWRNGALNMFESETY